MRIQSIREGAWDCSTHGTRPQSANIRLPIYYTKKDQN